MACTKYILDTNIITAILKKNAVVAKRLRSALEANAELVMCPVVFYEIYRGLLHKDAKNQLAFLLSYVETYTWSDLQRTDWERAADLWTRQRREGVNASDADLLIAACALQREAIVVTDNMDHFVPLGAEVENWLR